VWDNVDKYPSLEARTVTAATAISRLKSIGGVQFLEADERSLRSLRATRNAIEHYEWRASEKEAKIIVGHSLSFAIGFAQDQLGTDLSEEFKSDDTWAMLLNELYDFARAHGIRLEARLRANEGYPSCCEECGELTVPTWGGSCELCGHWQSVDE
jgi:sugar phosphate isomerase/epimerase